MPEEFKCNLTSEEFQVRKRDYVQKLNKLQSSKQVLDSGVRLIFPHSEQTLNMVKEFVQLENQCCSFFDFSIQESKSDLSLEITWPEGAQDFITHELELA